MKCPVCGSGRGSNIYCWRCEAPLPPVTDKQLAKEYLKHHQQRNGTIKPLKKSKKPKTKPNPYLEEHDVYCDECQDHYIYDAFNQVWWFTVEQDIGIAARTEEEAERKFHNKYGGKTILGIIRPVSTVNQVKRTGE